MKRAHHYATCEKQLEDMRFNQRMYKQKKLTARVIYFSCQMQKYAKLHRNLLQNHKTIGPKAGQSLQKDVYQGATLVRPTMAEISFKIEDTLWFPQQLCTVSFSEEQFLYFVCCQEKNLFSYWNNNNNNKYNNNKILFISHNQ